MATLYAGTEGKGIFRGSVIMKHMSSGPQSQLAEESAIDLLGGMGEDRVKRGP